jgi:hypothetical protein
MADRFGVVRRHGMILRSSMRKAFYWMSLPAEIRLMILEAITQQKYPGWASLASVCKEWQLFIEKRNFHQLRVQVPCLGAFERIIVPRRELVRHIWLDIELPRFTCWNCKRDESFSWTSRNSSIVSNGIWKLFCVLSAWKPGNGLTLGLNAHCPIDSEHWFKDWYLPLMTRVMKTRFPDKKPTTSGTIHNMAGLMANRFRLPLRKLYGGSSRGWTYTFEKNFLRWSQSPASPYVDNSVAVFSLEHFRVYWTSSVAWNT